MNSPCNKDQFLSSFLFICHFIFLVETGKFVCENCEDKQKQGNTCNIVSSRSNKIGPFIRLQTIAKSNKEVKNDSDDYDLDQDPREKFFFVETSGRDYMREF